LKQLINIYRPTIKRKDLEYVLNCMMHDKIDYGDFALSFEKKLCERTEVKNAVVINSFFDAIQVLLHALGVNEGDEIIIPSFAPQVYLNAILLKKAVPVLVDLEPGLLRPSIEGIKNAINEKTKAVFIIYYFGFAFDPRPYLELFPTVIEDISTVIGAKLNDMPLGQYGKYAIADFSSKGLITTGDGACIFSANRKNFNNVFSLFEIDYDIDYSPRFSCLMPDLNAAMGISQDENLNHKLNLREKIGKIYEDAIRRSHGITLIHQETPVRFYSDFPAFFKSGLKDIIAYFKKNGIEVARPFQHPLHHYLNLNKADFKNTENFYLHTLLLPIYSSLSKKDVDLIAKVLASII